MRMPYESFKVSRLFPALALEFQSSLCYSHNLFVCCCCFLLFVPTRFLPTVESKKHGQTKNVLFVVGERFQKKTPNESGCVCIGVFVLRLHDFCDFDLRD